MLHKFYSLQQITNCFPLINEIFPSKVHRVWVYIYIIYFFSWALCVEDLWTWRLIWFVEQLRIPDSSNVIELLNDIPLQPYCLLNKESCSGSQASTPLDRVQYLTTVDVFVAVYLPYNSETNLLMCTVCTACGSYSRYMWNNLYV